MAARFGRNKRRAARARIAELEQQVTALGQRAVAAELREQFAAEAAMNAWLKNSGHIARFRDEVAGKIAQSLVPELQEAARKVLAAAAQSARDRGGRSLLELSAMQHVDAEKGAYTVLRGRFSEVEWNIVVH